MIAPPLLSLSASSLFSKLFRQGEFRTARQAARPRVLLVDGGDEGEFAKGGKGKDGDRQRADKDITSRQTEEAAEEGLGIRLELDSELEP